MDPAPSRLGVRPPLDELRSSALTSAEQARRLRVALWGLHPELEAWRNGDEYEFDQPAPNLAP